jgi:flagellar L-ring protein precursor FlgH
VGDVLTIVLTERTDASKSASTKTAKSQSVEIAEPSLFGRNVTWGGKPLLSASIEGDRDLNGEGSSQQSNRLTGSITVQVVGRHPNGNLLVKGEKWLTLNQGQELVRIEGIVRPTDISPANTVASTQVADARITYNGRGALADSNAMGWLARFFNHPVWPF